MNVNPDGNWFVGLRARVLPAVPPTLRDALAAAPPAVRVFDPADWHLTLSFLGRCGEDAAQRVWQQARALDFPGFAIQLGEVMPMGPARRYSALSAVIEAGREPLEAWMEEARAIGPIDPRPVKAHLTLARPQRQATEAQRAEALAWGCALPTKGWALRVDQLALFAWAQDRAQRLFAIAAERGTSSA